MKDLSRNGGWVDNSLCFISYFINYSQGQDLLNILKSNIFKYK